MAEVKRVKKKRFNFLKFLVVLLAIYLLVAAFLDFSKSPIKNIMIIGNNKLSDELLIETANLENYPSFMKTRGSGICKKIKKLDLINACKVSKKMGYVVEIKIEEYKILYKMRSNDDYILSNGKSLNSSADVPLTGVAVLINYIPDEIMDTLNKQFAQLDYDILNKISEIEYSPTTYDDERFILYMRDGNMVYITLLKTKRLNKYDEVKKELEGHSGILYLDSGNYFEIKD